MPCLERAGGRDFSERGGRCPGSRLVFLSPRKTPIYLAPAATRRRYPKPPVLGRTRHEVRSGFRFGMPSRLHRRELCARKREADDPPHVPRSGGVAERAERKRIDDVQRDERKRQRMNNLIIIRDAAADRQEQGALTEQEEHQHIDKQAYNPVSRQHVKIVGMRRISPEETADGNFNRRSL